MQMPLPNGRKSYKRIRVDWKGLNRRHPYDTGYISEETNGFTAEYPDFTPAPMPETTNWFNVNDMVQPLGLYGFDEFLILFYVRRTDSANKPYTLTMTYMDVKTDAKYSTDFYEFKSSLSEMDLRQRKIVQFNVLGAAENVLTGSYEKKLLIFPDRRVADWDIPGKSENNTFNTVSMGSEVPEMDDVTVHLSRLFGVKDGRIYASGFNDYTNWNVDTAFTEEAGNDGTVNFTDGYDENNAWVSMTQSNTEASGDFTAITTYQGHVVAFKKDYMHEIYNTKNPFRVQDIYAEGCIDKRSIQEIGGMLLFAAEDGVKTYTGGKPKLLSYELDIRKLKTAIAGGDDRYYYLYCVDEKNREAIYVYDTYCGQWSKREAPAAVVNFARTDKGVYALCENGLIYKIDSKNYGHEWNFETDFMTAISSSYGTVDIKHIRRLQMYVHIEGSLQLYLLYDDETFNAESSHLVFDSAGRTGDRVIRVIPRKTACYHFRLYAKGIGFVRLHQLEILIENGGEPNVTN